MDGGGRAEGHELEGVLGAGGGLGRCGAVGGGLGGRGGGDGGGDGHEGGEECELHLGGGM